MKSSSALVLHLVLVLILEVCSCSEQDKVKASKLKLSDLPVLKRWEIPSKLSVIGRRHKDLFTDSDRSSKRSFWEAKPEYSLHELESEDDPEKIYMDLHNSRNILEEDLSSEMENHNNNNDVKTKKNNVAENIDLKSTKIVASKVIEGFTSGNLHQKTSVEGSKKVIASNAAKKSKRPEKKRLIALRPFLAKKDKNVKKKRSRRSLEIDYDSEMDENFEDALTEDVSQSQQQEDHGRARRSVLADFYFDQYDDIDSPDSDLSPGEKRTRERRSVQNPVNRPKSLGGKRSIVKNTVQSSVQGKSKHGLHEENLVKVFKKHNLIKIKPKGVSTEIKRSSTSSKVIGKSDAEDAQKRAKVMIQKEFFPSKNNHRSLASSVRHIVPQSSAKRTLPSVEVKVLSKSLIDHEVNSSPGAKSEVNRQHISHPTSSDKSSTDSINTANVARAVAVAMEQLKRDKMWGKVFVHVRPSGELKVMVQETRKMGEEN